MDTLAHGRSSVFWGRDHPFLLLTAESAQARQNEIGTKDGTKERLILVSRSSLFVVMIQTRVLCNEPEGVE